MAAPLAMSESDAQPRRCISTSWAMLECMDDTTLAAMVDRERLRERFMIKAAAEPPTAACVPLSVGLLKRSCRALLLLAYSSSVRLSTA
eukprot:1254917-Pleurochrysis_carterae.AAC.5